MSGGGSFISDETILRTILTNLLSNYLPRRTATGGGFDGSTDALRGCWLWEEWGSPVALHSRHSISILAGNHVDLGMRYYAMPSAITTMPIFTLTTTAS
jgi:hypothetical protein